MHTIEQQVEGFRIRMLRVSHEVAGKLSDLIDEDIRSGVASYNPDTEILTMRSFAGVSLSMKIMDNGFMRIG
jgi:hypothetical protein